MPPVDENQPACGRRAADLSGCLVGFARGNAGAGIGRLLDGMLRGRRALLLRHTQTLCRRPRLQRRSGDWLGRRRISLSGLGRAALRRQNSVAAAHDGRRASVSAGSTRPTHLPSRRELLSFAALLTRLFPRPAFTTPQLISKTRGVKSACVETTATMRACALPPLQRGSARQQPTCVCSWTLQ